MHPYGRRYLAVSLLCALSLSVAAAEQSKPPAPRTRESKGNPPKSQPAANEAEPKQDQRGTKESPVIVQPLPVAKSDKETAQEQADREREATIQWWTVRLSGLTFFVLIVQSYVLWRQNEIMKVQSTIMTGQLSATESAAKTASESFLLLNRPYLDLGRWQTDGHVEIRNLGYAPAKLDLFHVFTGAAGSEVTLSSRPLAVVIGKDDSYMSQLFPQLAPAKSTRVIGYIL